MKICVLMSTYNGEKYIREQIDSILNQKNVDLDIMVRDDGSSDCTTKILNEYQKKGRLKWYTGKNLKPARSFLDLLKKCGNYDYYAFADQDDYWENDKLERAISKLNKYDSNSGKLYISCLNVVDSNLNFLYKSFIPTKINLKNEMIKNYATGCTMVFDDKLKQITEKYNCDYVAMHDSYIYRIALLNKSCVYIDQESRIRYRQHENNVLGMKHGFISVWESRLKRFLHSECIASNTAINFLKCSEKIINNDDKKYLYLLATYRQNFRSKLTLLTMKIFTNDEKLTNFLFKIKLLFNKI